jgi:hypothetical protein
MLLIASLGIVQTAVATGNTLRIDPPAQTVPQDGTFIAHVVQNAAVPTSGASATITFDPTLLQIQSVTRGAPYAGAPVFTGASTLAITAANTTGSLVGVAAAFLPPDAVPAGDADYLDVTFKAVGCGTAQLGLPTGVTDAGLLDGSAGTYGNALGVSTVGGTVGLCVAGSQTPSGSLPPSPAASTTPGPSPTSTAKPSVTPPPLPPGNSVRIEPYYTGVVKNGGFSIRVVQHATVAVSGVSASITFDPTIVQIVSVTKSSAYAAAPVFLGAGASAVTTANTNGKLANVATAFLPPSNLAAGEADFIKVEFKAIACGSTDLGMPVGSTDAAMLDGRTATYGIPLTIKTVKGMVQACDPKATPTPKPTPTRIPTSAPVTTAVPPTPATTPPTTGTGSPPADLPTPELTVSPPPAAASSPATGVVIPPRPPSATPTSPAMNSVAFVGLGVAGVMGGLLLVLMISAAMVAGLVAPWLLVRARAGRGR